MPDAVPVAAAGTVLTWLRSKAFSIGLQAWMAMKIDVTVQHSGSRLVSEMHAGETRLSNQR